MSGRLGSAAPAADTDTTLYTVPSGKVATINVSAVNRGAEDAKVRIGVTIAATPDDADWIEYDAVIPANGGVLERTAIVVGSGETVMVRDDKGAISYRCHGFEEDV